MQQEPTADKVDGSTANGKRQLSKKYQPDKTNILVFDAHIYDRLGEERQNKLQQTSHEQPQDNLPEVLAVLLDIAKEEPERAFLFRELFQRC